MIPFKKVNIDQREIDAVTEVMKSGMIGLGNKVYEFEKELAEYTGFKYAVAVDSCTSALFLSLRSLDNPDRLNVVSVPSMTVPLVAAALFESEIDFMFDDRTDWVGSAYQIKGTNVWDSAHELEMGFRTRFPDDAVVCVSFYPTKNIGSADGGAILTDDEKLATWARQVSTYGRDQGTKYKNSWDCDIIMKGYKRHYTNLQSAICLAQLGKLNSMNHRRAEIRDMYNKAFGLNNKSLYLYRIDVCDRDKFIFFMKASGIECGVHFKPLHMMTAFQDIKFANGADKEFVEEAYKHTISLPFFDLMTNEEVERVIESVKESGQYGEI
jgi:dTDP-4-amino-4,6-dideoxygalactose transaminase